MQTELIYSKNRCEDIDAALEQIAAFRQGYRFMIETRTGHGTGLFRVLLNRLRIALSPHGFSELQESDRALEASENELKQLRDLVEISNVLQDTYQKYRGKLDIRVKDKGKKGYLLTILTLAYSDTLPGGGLIRIPQMKKEFYITANDVANIFRRGVVDFSWLDGMLALQAQALSSVTESFARQSAAQKALPMKQYLPAPEFEDAGDNPVDILD